MDYQNNIELLKLALNGDENATEQLVKNNMGLVRSLAMRFLDRGVEYDDLVQLGSIGMLKAIRSFDLSKNVAFSTYAVPLIIGEIRRFLRDDGLIKVSRIYKQENVLIMRERERYFDEFGKEPSLEELSERCHLPKEEILISMDATTPILSLSSSLNRDDEDFTLENVISEERSDIEIKIDHMALTQAINTLPPLWKQIVTFRYLKEYSQQKTAEALGITQVKVSREEKKLLAELKKQLS